MSRNIGGKMVVIISGWKVISNESAVYFNCMQFPNFLQACFAVMFKKNNKSYKTRKEQQKNRKGRSTSLSKTKIKPNSDLVK